MKAIEHKSPDVRRRMFAFLIGATIAIIAAGTIFYHYVENLKWLDSFYFSVITLTTVGYGDITPKTDLGKMFTVVYILVGIGIIVAFVNTLTDRVGEHRKEKLLEKMKSKDSTK